MPLPIKNSNILPCKRKQPSLDANQRNQLSEATIYKDRLLHHIKYWPCKEIPVVSEQYLSTNPDVKKAYEERWNIEKIILIHKITTSNSIPFIPDPLSSDADIKKALEQRSTTRGKQSLNIMNKMPLKKVSTTKQSGIDNTEKLTLKINIPKKISLVKDVEKAYIDLCDQEDDVSDNEVLAGSSSSTSSISTEKKFLLEFIERNLNYFECKNNYIVLNNSTSGKVGTDIAQALEKYRNDQDVILTTNTLKAKFELSNMLKEEAAKLQDEGQYTDEVILKVFKMNKIGLINQATPKGRGINSEEINTYFDYLMGAKDKIFPGKRQKSS